MEAMTDYTPTKQIKVSLNFGNTQISVARLATRDHKIYFEYDEEFLAMRIEISPIKLPLESGLKSFDPYLFEGLPGVFNDSLPDGWGRLLLDRLLKSKNILPKEFTALDRLAHVGRNGLGALVYEPDHSPENINHAINLDALAQQTQAVFADDAESALEELVALNGSSTGARPKALVGINNLKTQIIHHSLDLPVGYDHWIVKFPNSMDGSDAGAIEYVYSLMAKEGGIKMPESHLFSAVKGAGYFSTQRFDRIGNQRLHMHTASGLLHSDFRTPILDYENLLALTEVLTKDAREVEKMFRLAVFNVLAHNRDDHGKNFSFLMNEMGEWKLSPAYDLTFSSEPGRHQSTMVMGEGQNVTLAHLKKLGQSASMAKSSIDAIIEQTQNALNNWHDHAKHYGVTQSNIKLIGNRLSALRK